MQSCCSVWYQGYVSMRSVRLRMWALMAPGHKVDQGHTQPTLSTLTRAHTLTVPFLTCVSIPLCVTVYALAHSSTVPLTYSLSEGLD